MRLVVGVNHAAPFHVGGSEKVVQQITESMTRDFDIECHVVTRFANKTVTHNGVTIEPMRDDAQQFIGQVNALKPDHFLVYSDSFHHWPTVVRQAEAFKCSKSVAMVGMNHMRSREELFRVFRRKHEQFTVITHSDNYLDYKQCNSFDIPVKVIPNAIDMNEFEDHGFSFRDKYDIAHDKKMVLCVSNFFPGKGQEHLLHVLKKLKNKGHDFVAVFICTPVNFRPAEVMRQRFTQQIKKSGIDHKILVSIPREDTAQAFLEADVFAFPSQIEVAPLVMLESMAAGLPWVAMNVGNVPTLEGGLMVQGGKKVNGKLTFDSRVYEEFADAIDSLLSDTSTREKKGKEGRDRILAEFDWAQVRKQYHEVFTS